MPSFDVVSQVDKQEVRNALEQANRDMLADAVTGRRRFAE